MALSVAMTVQVANTSLYPEVDIASKIPTEEKHEIEPFASPYNLSQLFWPLNNAVSTQIRRRLTATRFYVRFSENNYEEPRRVILTLEDNGLRLVRASQKPRV